MEALGGTVLCVCVGGGGMGSALEAGSGEGACGPDVGLQGMFVV